MLNQLRKALLQSHELHPFGRPKSLNALLSGSIRKTFLLSRKQALSLCNGLTLPKAGYTERNKNKLILGETLIPRKEYWSMLQALALQIVVEKVEFHELMHLSGKYNIPFDISKEYDFYWLKII